MEADWSINDNLGKLFFGDNYVRSESYHSRSVSISPWGNVDCITLESWDRHYGISLGEDELKTLAEIYNIDPILIRIKEWEEINPGCDTCGDGSWGKLTIELPKPLGMTDSEIETRIPLALEKLRVKRAEDAKEEEEHRQKARLEREIERKKSKLDHLKKELANKERKVAEKSILRIFELFQKQIIDSVVEEFPRYSKLERKMVGLELQDSCNSPIRKLIFAMHGNPEPTWKAIIENLVKTDYEKIKVADWWKKKVNLKTPFES